MMIVVCFLAIEAMSFFQRKLVTEEACFAQAGATEPLREPSRSPVICGIRKKIQRVTRGNGGRLKVEIDSGSTTHLFSPGPSSFCLDFSQSSTRTEHQIA